MAVSLQDVYLTVAQTRRLDTLAVARYRMPSIVLMENAARSALAAVVAAFPPGRFARVGLLIGGGNNGGDALALARLMHNVGYAVRVQFAADPAALKGDAAVNRDIVAAMNLPTESLVPGEDALDLARAGQLLNDCDLAIDGLLGTGLKDAARRPLADLIELVNNLPNLPVVALDVPSGFDADSGMPAGEGEGAAIIARLTVTFGANKVGYRQPGATAYTGQVVVGCIGAPIELAAEVATPPAHDSSAVH